MVTEHAMNMLTAAEQALASIPLPPATGKLPCGARTVQWEELDGSPAKTRAAGPKVFGRQRARVADRAWPHPRRPR